VCPAKHSGLTSRADHLVRMVREKAAQGVIILLLKFCDPHAFDYPYLKNALDREGVPSLLLEVEDQLPPEGQLKTRFEAFLEMFVKEWKMAEEMKVLDPEKEKRKIQSAKKMKEIMTAYYIEAKTGRGRPERRLHGSRVAVLWSRSL